MGGFCMVLNQVKCLHQLRRLPVSQDLYSFGPTQKHPPCRWVAGPAWFRSNGKSRAHTFLVVSSLTTAGTHGTHGSWAVDGIGGTWWNETDPGATTPRPAVEHEAKVCKTGGEQGRKSKHGVSFTRKVSWCPDPQL